jgi:hypothetical protein
VYDLVVGGVNIFATVGYDTAGDTESPTLVRVEIVARTGKGNMATHEQVLL